MTGPAALVVFAAGVLAGAVNTVVGSGSLISFPTLVALGYSPLVANVSNAIGLVAGSVSGAVGYRRELAGQRHRAWLLGPWAVAGGLAGALLLLRFPAVFQSVVPWLVLLAVAMVLIQPRLAAALAGRRDRHPHGGIGLRAGILLTAVYGGYFGAAQSVLQIGILGIGIDDSLQRLNALKNVLTALVNGIAAVVFVIAAPVAWLPVLLLAAGSTLGGQMGARYGRRLPAPALRAIIVAGGVAVAVKLLV